MRIRLLGPVEVVTPTGVEAVLRPRQRAVLAYLLLAANRLVATDSIVDAVWGDTPPGTARNQVQIHVSGIRRVLRTAGLPDPIRTSRTGYRASADRTELDLLDFTQTLATAGTAADRGDLRQAVDLTRGALALWRGPALGGVTASYVDAARVTLEERRLVAIETLAGWELRLGRHRDVVADLTPLVHEHPLREGLARQLSLALHRGGRTPEALAILRTLRTALAEEYGLGLSSDLAALEVAMLRDDPGLHTGDRPLGPVHELRNVLALLSENLGACVLVDLGGLPMPAALRLLADAAGAGRRVVAYERRRPAVRWRRRPRGVRR